jgi:hypothetical protein
MMKNLSIKYRFLFPHGREVRVDLELDRETLELRGYIPDRKPDWTRLDFHQCPNCPLLPAGSPYCPLALNLVPIVELFEGVVSHDEVAMRVVTEERTISQVTTAQRAVGALMGLVIPSSGCPHSTFLRPMARFHLPLATNEETFYRATSMYLLAQYFVRKEGGNGELELDGLVRRYSEMEIVNVSIVDRLRAATTTDSSVNALVLLDVYAKTMGEIIEESFNKIRHLFSPYFNDEQGNS